MNQEKIQHNSGLLPGHMIDTLQKEHEQILSFLDKLGKVNLEIQKMNGFEPAKKEFSELKHIAEHLVAAEPHHQREEQVLFPELEKRGIEGPPQMMRMEHEELRKNKHTLEDLAEKVENMNFNDFKAQINLVVQFIVPTLRDHIFKENNILYPMALEAIPEQKIWQEMKKAADKIGYCCFTPNE
jgi:DUF438 domain-containing protein